MTIRTTSINIIWGKCPKLTLSDFGPSLYKDNVGEKNPKGMSRENSGDLEK